MSETLSSETDLEQLDRALESFFEKEMPAPRPTANVPAQLGRPVRKSSWAGPSKRLALVACVSLILSGYLALASRFPTEPEPGLALDRSRTIGSKVGPRERVLTPRGAEALLVVQPLENGELHFDLTFYSTDSGKVEQLSYDGALGSIERQIKSDARERRLPDRLQGLVDSALQRVRSFNPSQKAPGDMP